MNFPPNHNYESHEEDFSPSILNNMGNYSYFSPPDDISEDYIANCFFQTQEAQSPSINKNDKNMDIFQNVKMEKVELRIVKTKELTIISKKEEKKEKGKKKLKTKKIVSLNKKRKLDEIANENKHVPKHTKYSPDNIRRKCKCIILNYMMEFINQKIKEKYKTIGQGMKIKELMKINKSQSTNIKADFEIQFMNKKLKDIFSDNITKRINKFTSSKNKDLINELINEKDGEKKDYFNNLFNLTFLDCVNHFIGKQFIPILEDLDKFNEIIKNSAKLKKIHLKINDEDYLDNLRDYFENYENKINRIRKRKNKSE